MNNWMGWCLQELSNLMTTHGGLFVSTAVTLARTAAGILIAATGIRIAYGTINSRAEILRAVVTISLVMGMLQYYDSPVPGIGLSFHNMITDEGVWLANQIEQGSNDNLNAMFNNVMEDQGSPNGWSVMSYVRCALLVISVVSAQAALLFVVAYGYIAMAIFILLGPLFVVGLLFQWSAGYFYSWLRGLLAYSFYPVVANAFVWVFARFYTDWFQAHPLPWSLTDTPTLLTLFLAITMAFTFGILKVPSLVSHLFSGGSGDHAFPGFGRFR